MIIKNWEKLIVEETFVVMWTLTHKTENLGELEYLVVSPVTCLNDYGILIGRTKSCNEGLAD